MCAQCSQGSKIIFLLFPCHDNSSSIVRSSGIFGCIDRNLEVICLIQLLVILLYIQCIDMHTYCIYIPSTETRIMPANICHPSCKYEKLAVPCICVEYINAYTCTLRFGRYLFSFIPVWQAETRIKHNRQLPCKTMTYHDMYIKKCIHMYRIVYGKVINFERKE